MLLTGGVNSSYWRRSSSGDLRLSAWLNATTDVTICFVILGELTLLPSSFQISNAEANGEKTTEVSKKAKMSGDTSTLHLGGIPPATLNKVHITWTGNTFFLNLLTLLTTRTWSETAALIICDGLVNLTVVHLYSFRRLSLSRCIKKNNRSLKQKTVCCLSSPSRTTHTSVFWSRAPIGKLTSLPKAFKWAVNKRFIGRFSGLPSLWFRSVKAQPFAK